MFCYLPAFLVSLFYGGDVEVSTYCFCAVLACAQFLICSGAMVLKCMQFLLEYCPSVFVKSTDFSHKLLSYSIALQIIITWVQDWGSRMPQFMTSTSGIVLLEVTVQF
jgi:hypothetical protein